MKTIEMLESRIALLKERSKDNGNIVKKLERQVRALKKNAAN